MASETVDILQDSIFIIAIIFIATNLINEVVPVYLGVDVYLGVGLYSGMGLYSGWAHTQGWAYTQEWAHT